MDTPYKSLSTLSEFSMVYKYFTLFQKFLFLLDNPTRFSSTTIILCKVEFDLFLSTETCIEYNLYF